MQTEEMISATEFCIYHNIELSFITSLQHSGLIVITELDQNVLIPADQLPQLEKMVRLFQEMDINLEGIETITYLLQRLKEKQIEIMHLKTRLDMYEDQI